MPEDLVRAPSAQGLRQRTEDARHLEQRVTIVVGVRQLRHLLAETAKRERHLIGLGTGDVDAVATQVRRDLLLLHLEGHRGDTRVEAPVEHRAGGLYNDAHTLAGVHECRAASGNGPYLRSASRSRISVSNCFSSGSAAASSPGLVTRPRIPSYTLTRANTAAATIRKLSTALMNSP